MTVALFGASGRTGSLLLAQARARGWPVRALVRSAGRVAESEGLEVVLGDAREAQAIDRVLAGNGRPADTVLCALGMHDITQPATDFSDSVKAIVAGMQRHGLRRIVAIASGGALSHPGGGYRAEHGLPEWLRHVAAEHLRNHRTLSASGLDWTLMCPLNLVDDIAPGSARWLPEDLPAGSGETAYADLAQVMCELVAERGAIGQRVGIVSVRQGLQP